MVSPIHSLPLTRSYPQGFDALFFARMDYQDYTKRSVDKTLEFVWRPTQSLGSATQLWVHGMWGAFSSCLYF